MADKKRKDHHHDAKDGGNFKRNKHNDNNRTSFRFSSQNAAQWPLFQQKHAVALMEEGISYLLDDAEVRQIQTKTPRPAHRPFVPANNSHVESDAEREARNFEISLDVKEWERAESIRAKKKNNYKWTQRREYQFSFASPTIKSTIRWTISLKQTASERRTSRKHK
jgi:hypothetical protein